LRGCVGVQFGFHTFKRLQTLYPALFSHFKALDLECAHLAARAHTLGCGSRMPCSPVDIMIMVHVYAVMCKASVAALTVRCNSGLLAGVSRGGGRRSSLRGLLGRRCFA
jgi:hypothetical protein